MTAFDDAVAQVKAAIAEELSQVAAAMQALKDELASGLDAEEAAAKVAELIPAIKAIYEPPAPVVEEPPAPVVEEPVVEEPVTEAPDEDPEEEI